MLDFLRNFGITNVVIDEIKVHNSSANLYNFSCNKEDILKILGYLKELGVCCIDELLIHRINIFFIDFEKFKKTYYKLSNSSFIELINEDYAKIDEL